MSASVTGRKQCVTCIKSVGVMTCDGCGRSFCGNHVMEHRQELANQLDEIMQEYDLFQELERSSRENSLLNQINEWENESITKIQVAATAARADLQQIRHTSRESITKTCHDIKIDLRSSLKADDFLENDLDRWMEQLKELKLEFDSSSSSSSIKLVEDAESSISLIMIKHSDLTKKNSRGTKERFSQIFGEGVLQDESTVVRHIGTTGHYAHALGKELYSQGRHVVRIQVGHDGPLYDTFLGCTSFQSENEKPDFGSSTSAGWFGNKQIFHQGNMISIGYNSNGIQTDDILTITFDCGNRQIELYHERTEKTSELPVDIGKAPFPWRFLVALYRQNDFVRIIPDD